MKNRPMTPITASGTNLSTVVATCSIPDCRAPAMLVSVSSQIVPMPTAAASVLFSPSSGQKTAK
jgi:hypothetical protein